MCADNQDVRPPAVAGLFYPADPEELGAFVERELEVAAAPPEGASPSAIISPHAGYEYSGPIAATAYRALDGVGDRMSRVVIVGPSHRVRVDGMAVSSASAFETPLGSVRLDGEARDALLDLDTVVVQDSAHAREHSLEVQLPFLQRCCPNAAIVPIVVGTAGGPDVADALEKVWGEEETLVVASSDLSHYLDYATAKKIDEETVAIIEAGNVDALDYERACGAGGVRGLMVVAGRRGLRTKCIDLRNSGDTAGSRDRVVGYGAFIVA